MTDDVPRVSDDIKSGYPHLSEFWPYLELLDKESDRGKVLISCGFLEERLKRILLAFMLENSQAQKLVEGANAPLGTFAARTTACFVFGLISEDEHHDLILLRRIRNDFAHDIHTSFTTQNVVDRCRELRMKRKTTQAHKEAKSSWPLRDSSKRRQLLSS
jgi:DNA-binding MltR family transcriptional regulator